MKYRKHWNRCSFLLILLCALPLAARAEGVRLDTLKSHWGLVLGGAATTLAIHELGHLMVAGLEGADPYFDGTTIKYREAEGTDEQNLRLSSSGFQAQWITSEYAFHQLRRNDLNQSQRAWNAGLVLGHIGITAAYLLVIQDQDYGDVEGISNATGLSTTEVLGLLTLPAFLDSLRLFGENSPDWLGWTSAGYKAVGITAVWTF